MTNIFLLLGKFSYELNRHICDNNINGESYIRVFHECVSYVHLGLELYMLVGNAKTL